MSSRTQGRVTDRQGRGWEGLRVSIRVPTALFGNEIGHAETGASGDYDFTYIPDMTEAGGHRDLELRVQDRVGRVLVEESLTDISDAVLINADIVIDQADGSGYLVTLGEDHTGTGEPGQCRDTAVRQ